jgi:release factor glutamine methyltransferase
MSDSAALLRQIAERLPGETPELDAQVLLAHVLGRERTWLLAHLETIPSPAQETALETDVRRLEEGTPLPYVLGRWEFFGLDFEVTPDVLIPRPETELLVETALHWLRNHPSGSGQRLLDVGTGSGCIAVSLAVHAPEARVTATDLSAAALEVALRNAARHGVQDRVRFLQCDLLTPVEIPDTDLPPAALDPAAFEIVTANLPYIPSDTLTGLDVYRHEPTLALYGGPDGLELIRRLLDALGERMLPDCLALLEIESSLGRAARALAEAAFPAANIEIKRDLAGYDRLVVIET